MGREGLTMAYGNDVMMSGTGSSLASGDLKKQQPLDAQLNAVHGILTQCHDLLTRIENSPNKDPGDNAPTPELGIFSAADMIQDSVNALYKRLMVLQERLGRF
jgi:hypothetical protein